MNLSFRKANIADVELISKLAEKIWKQHYISIISAEQIEYMLQKMYSKESLINQINSGHEFTIVLNNNISLGYISLSSMDSKNYFLHKFYIDIDKQNMGIGSKLFDYILSQIPNAISIELTVNRQNFKAINFYFKKGFSIKDVADFDIGNGFFMNDFIMIKNFFNS